MEIISLFATIFGIKKCNLDLEDLKRVCLEHSQREKSEFRSNAGGYQGHNFDYEPLKDILAETMREIQIPEKPIVSMGVSSWLNINPKGSFNVLHDHSGKINNFLSGVFYVKVPENSGNIYFKDPRGLVKCFPDEQYFATGIDEMELQPQENMLLIFPTWLSHRVGMNMSEEDRISIAFNINNVKFQED